ncbi:MAG: ATP-binding protein [Lachnospiraceae bacterium]
MGGTISITAKENTIFTELVIEDNDPGFDMEDLPHFFERFYKGRHASSTSVGIGLALARIDQKEIDALMT